MTKDTVNGLVLGLAMILAVSGLSDVWQNIQPIIPTPTPTPTPDPTPTPVPPTPQPDPTPVDPVGPLGQLVSPEHRLHYVTFFQDMATVIRNDTGLITTTDQIRQIQDKASQLFRTSNQIQPNQELSRQLEQRQTLLFSLESRPLTPELRTAIANFYLTTAADF